ncbi:MAG: bifunctional hydroxymethylpyrimidine kinase/phosphomethylpyrimidine kinase [Pseudomonadota bacterium]
MEHPEKKPVVLVIAGHDPVGGAGMQADIEAVAALGGHAATAVTALTVQDTRNVSDFTVTAPSLLRAQLDAILGDLSPSAVKIGMIGSGDNAREIVRALRRIPQVPVVLDPVLVAGGGGSLALDDLQRVLIDELLPLSAVTTPNGPEARTLAGLQDLDACARVLMRNGAKHVLVTGGHEPGPEVVTRLYGPQGEIAAHAWPRLPGNYHGSGCTLAAATAALLAHGNDVETSARAALDYTWHTLENAQRPGHGQAIPGRFYAMPAWHGVRRSLP